MTRKLLFGIVAVLFSTSLAHAQAAVKPCVETSNSSGGITSYNCQPVTAANPLPIAPTAYPSGATPMTASVTGTTGAVSANLAGATGKTTYICGYQVQANATAATSIPNASITGAIGGTMPFIEGVAAAPGIATTAQTFSPCIPASAVNTPIGVNAGAAGAGGNTVIYAWGYQQ